MLIQVNLTQQLQYNTVYYTDWEILHTVKENSTEQLIKDKNLRETTVRNLFINH